MVSTLEFVLCTKPNGFNFYGLKCLLGECSSYRPSKKLSIFLIEESISVVIVSIFENIQGGIRIIGKKKKRKVLSIKEMKCRDFLILYRDHLKKLINHSCVYRWQAM